VQRHIWTRDDAQEITIMLRKRIIYALAAAAVLFATAAGAVGASHAGASATAPICNSDECGSAADQLGGPALADHWEKVIIPD
jgi:hypothetical protein